MEYVTLNTETKTFTYSKVNKKPGKCIACDGSGWFKEPIENGHGLTCQACKGKKVQDAQRIRSNNYFNMKQKEREEAHNADVFKKAEAELKAKEFTKAKLTRLKKEKLVELLLAS